MEDGCITQSPFPDPDYFKTTLEAVRGSGILKQEIFSQSAKISPASSFYSHDVIDEAKLVSDNDWIARGWATLENHGRSADAVLLSYQDDEGEPRIFAVAPVKFDRPDVSNVKQNSAYIRSGWTVQFSRSSLPKRKVKIKAWAYDVKTKNSYIMSWLSYNRPIHELNCGKIGYEIQPKTPKSFD